MVDAPTGTVTFLFTDVEGSTRLWEQEPIAMRTALTRHDEILREAIESHGGRVVKQTGDGFHAVFAAASDAVAAAVTAQRAVEHEPWSSSTRLRMRVGLHTGEAQERDGDYYGPSTNRAARLMSVAHGGQVLLSDVTAGIVGSHLPADFDVLPLGEHRLDGVSSPMALFQLAAPGLRRDFPPLATLDARRGNLPSQLSSFVGRADELREIASLLCQARVVTLVGVGGVGKTRLALQVADVLRGEFRDGTWLVELAGVRDPEAVPATIAAALRGPEQPGTPVVDVLAQFLRGRELLLVIDNCEHLLEPVTELVRSLERECAGLVILATSREGLGIAGERIVAIRSLDNDESVELFVERAIAVRHDFELSAGNEPAVREICRRLDGIPLAIELAAARVGALSPAQIAQRLDQRFRLLAGGERGAVERHATLRAAIDWSYELLSAEERLTLARLSVFAGGCSLEAAESVCAGGIVASEDVLDLVSKLATRSLLVADTADAGDTRYALLETIRQYAEERFEPGDRSETRDRHARFYAEWLPLALEGMQSASQNLWFASADREIENLRSAIDWAAETENYGIARNMLAAAIRPPLCFLPSGRAVLDAAERILEFARRDDRPELALTAAAAAVAAAFALAHDRADDLIDEAFARAAGRDDRAVMHANAARAYLFVARGDLHTSLPYVRESVAWERRMGTPYELSWALSELSSWLAGTGASEEARVVAHEALSLARETGVPSLLVGPLVSLANASEADDPEAARAYLREATTVRDSLTMANPHDRVLLSVMTNAARLAERDVVLRTGEEILRLFPDPLFLAIVLESLSCAIADTSPEPAATLHGTVDALVPGLVQVEGLGTIRTQATQRIAARLDQQTIDALHDEGGRKSALEAADYARALIREALSD